MLSRYIVIALAFIGAGYRATQGAWLEAVGLFGLGAGLTLLKFSRTRPVLRSLAYLAFIVTVLALGAMLYRLYLSRA